MLFLQLIAFPILAATGIWLGLRCGRSRRWWVAVAVSLAIVSLVILGQRMERLHFVPPMSWLVRSCWNPLVMTAVVSVLLSTLLVRLPRLSTRRTVGLAMALLLADYGLLPALMPLTARAGLLAAGTVLNRQGVCLQQHAYSCGPAAAVTCLRRLGIPAEEGPLAVAAGCGPLVGTDGWALADAIERQFPGISSEYKYADQPEDLRLPAVADMITPRLGGHYMAVLAVERDVVVVGDPAGGLERMPRDVFLQQWKHGVIQMQRR